MDFDDEITLPDPTRWKVFGRTIPTDLPLTVFLVFAVVMVSWMTYIGMHADVDLPGGDAVTAAASGPKAAQLAQAMGKMQPQSQSSSGAPRIGINSSLPSQTSAQLRHQFYFAYIAACQANANAGRTLYDSDMNSQLASQKLNTVLNMGISYSRISDAEFSLTLTGNIAPDVLSSAEYAEISQYGQHVTPSSCADVMSQLRAMAAQQGGAAPAPAQRS
ncbi:hypothetical protein [Paraburkholderia humisilvae]|nr:hypothetical protein [Paraburkholderia humisilvae]